MWEKTDDSKSSTIHNIELCICQNFSMVAEIGGYSGLLIGFSVMDLAVILKASMDLIKRMKEF